MTQTSTHYATEELGPDGPTGRMLEVKQARLEDFGGNVLFGPTHPYRVEIESGKYRTQVRIVPAETGDVVAHADVVLPLTTRGSA